MKTFILVLFFYLMTLSTSVISATPDNPNSLSQVTGLSNKDDIKNKKVITFYKDSEFTIPEFDLLAGSLSFPMPILEEQDEYIKVMIKDKSVWVRSSRFKLFRKCAELTTTTPPTDKSINEGTGIRGAGNGKACIK